VSDLIWAVGLLAWLVVMGLLVTHLVNIELDDPYNYWSERGWIGRIKREKP